MFHEVPNHAKHCVDFITFLPCATWPSVKFACKPRYTWIQPCAESSLLIETRFPFSKFLMRNNCIYIYIMYIYIYTIYIYYFIYIYILYIYIYIIYIYYIYIICYIYIHIICICMEVSINGGTPSHHPFRTMGFSIINHPAIGVPPWLWKPPWDWSRGLHRTGCTSQRQ